MAGTDPDVYRKNMAVVSILLYFPQISITAVVVLVILYWVEITSQTSISGKPISLPKRTRPILIACMILFVVVLLTTFLLEMYMIQSIFMGVFLLSLSGFLITFGLRVLKMLNKFQKKKPAASSKTPATPTISQSGKSGKYIASASPGVNRNSTSTESDPSSIYRTKTESKVKENKETQFQKKLAKFIFLLGIVLMVCILSSLLYVFLPHLRVAGEFLFRLSEPVVSLLVVFLLKAKDAKKQAVEAMSSFDSRIRSGASRVQSKVTSFAEGTGKNRRSTVAPMKAVSEGNESDARNSSRISHKDETKNTSG